MVQADQMLVVFNSRFALLAFPFRFVLDHAISRPLVYISLLIYAAGIFLFALLAVWRSAPKSGAEVARKSEYFQECVDYLNGKSPPWEPGFLLFKILEGFQFRKSISEFGFQHPNCEFGIENTITSTNHLKGIDFIDVGCEAIKETPIQGEMRYERIVHFFYQ